VRPGRRLPGPRPAAAADPGRAARRSRAVRGPRRRARPRPVPAAGGRARVDRGVPAAAAALGTGGEPISADATIGSQPGGAGSAGSVGSAGSAGSTGPRARRRIPVPGWLRPRRTHTPGGWGSGSLPSSAGGRHGGRAGTVVVSIGAVVALVILGGMLGAWIDGRTTPPAPSQQTGSPGGDGPLPQPPLGGASDRPVGPPQLQLNQPYGDGAHRIRAARPRLGARPADNRRAGRPGVPRDAAGRPGRHLQLHDQPAARVSSPDRSRPGGTTVVATGPGGVRADARSTCIPEAGSRPPGSTTGPPAASTRRVGQQGEVCRGVISCSISTSTTTSSESRTPGRTRPRSVILVPQHLEMFPDPGGEADPGTPGRCRTGRVRRRRRSPPGLPGRFPGSGAAVWSCSSRSATAGTTSAPPGTARLRVQVEREQRRVAVRPERCPVPARCGQSPHTRPRSPSGCPRRPAATTVVEHRPGADQHGADPDEPAADGFGPRLQAREPDPASVAHRVERVGAAEVSRPRRRRSPRRISPRPAGESTPGRNCQVGVRSRDEDQPATVRIPMICPDGG